MKKLILSVALLAMALNSFGQAGGMGSPYGILDQTIPTSGPNFGGALGGAPSNTQGRTTTPLNSTSPNTNTPLGTPRGNEFNTIQEQQTPSGNFRSESENLEDVPPTQPDSSLNTMPSNISPNLPATPSPNLPATPSPNLPPTPSPNLPATSPPNLPATPETQ